MMAKATLLVLGSVLIFCLVNRVNSSVPTRAPVPAAQHLPCKDGGSRVFDASRHPLFTNLLERESATFASTGGTAAWGDKSPEFRMCSRGKYQSPVSLEAGGVIDKDGKVPLRTLVDPRLAPFTTSYADSPAYLVNNGHTLQLVFEKGSSLKYDGAEYALKQLHFHIPAEHEVDGEKAAMELHLVHVSQETNQILVVAVLYMPGKTNPFLEKFISKFPARISEVETEIMVNAAHALPKDPNYYVYDGSLTTPPCSEGVRWIVMKEVELLSAEQLDSLYTKLIMKRNSRPVQPLHHRTVLMSNMTEILKSWGTVPRPCHLKPSECENGSAMDVDACQCVRPITSPRIDDHASRCPPPWVGQTCDECTLKPDDCHHDSLLDFPTCSCVCPAGWTGYKCDECGLQQTDCLHNGDLDKKLCHCVNCQEPFEGQLCEGCGLRDSDCKNGGRVEKAICSCVDCDDLWEGNKCQRCMLQTSQCLNGGSADTKTCSCTNCNPPWGGRFCEKCNRSQSDCKNGSVLDKKTCSCLGCPRPWGGELCDECNRIDAECQNGASIDMNTCRCSQNCPNALATKPVCGDCESKSYHCLNKGLFDEELCTCNSCPGYWTGPRCEKCGLKEEHCQHGSKLDAKSCKCVKCKAPWSGELCNKCLLQYSDCLNGGILDTTLCECKRCAAPWTGAYCQECGLSYDSCLHDGVLDEATCRCTKCKDPWIGPFCDLCKHSPEDCQNGGVLEEKTCRCVRCQHPWEGSLCTKCMLIQEMCMNGGTLDKEQCRCVDCNPGWSGRLCDQCLRSGTKCEQGSKLDPRTCKCIKDCPTPHYGPFCSAKPCMIEHKDCKHRGKANYESCQCYCEDPWVGERCETCKIKVSECRHGGHLDTKLCHCMGCAKPWKGRYCHQCGRRASECRNGGKLNTETCRCNCPPNSVWAGPTCEECNIEKCFNGGTLDKGTCTCQCPKEFAGKLCEKKSCGSDCSKNGLCSHQTGKCSCNYLWGGQDCNLRKEHVICSDVGNEHIMGFDSMPYRGTKGVFIFYENPSSDTKDIVYSKQTSMSTFGIAALRGSERVEVACADPVSCKAMTVRMNCVEVNPKRRHTTSNGLEVEPTSTGFTIRSPEGWRLDIYGIGSRVNVHLTLFMARTQLSGLCGVWGEAHDDVTQVGWEKKRTEANRAEDNQGGFCDPVDFGQIESPPKRQCQHAELQEANKKKCCGSLSELNGCSSSDVKACAEDVCNYGVTEEYCSMWRTYHSQRCNFMEDSLLVKRDERVGKWVNKKETWLQRKHKSVLAPVDLDSSSE